MNIEKKRLFVAIPIEENVRKELMNYAEMCNELKRIRCTPYENIHVTLHFIGNIPAEELKDIKKKIGDISMRHQYFELRSDGIKIIKRSGIPKMIWVKFLRNDAFENLAKELQQNLPGDEKQPLPHITLARVKKENHQMIFLPEMQNDFTINVKKIELWESLTKNSGAEYSKIEEFNLNFPKD